MRIFYCCELFFGLNDQKPIISWFSWYSLIIHHGLELLHDNKKIQNISSTNIYDLNHIKLTVR